MKTIEVVAAVITDGKSIFATQRGYGEFKGGWEFPGGKIENNETPEEALIREIKEELDADITIRSFIRTIQHTYPEFHLTMHCYLCSLASDHMVLKEHDAVRWLTRDNIDAVAWLPADLEIIPDINDLMGWGTQ